MLLDFEISAPALQARLEAGEDLLLLDVRSFGEYASAHIDGARLVPYPALRERLASLTEWQDRPVVVYCQTGQRSLDALLILKEAGFRRIAMLDGGMERWLEHQQRNSHT